MEGLRGESSIAELCFKDGINQNLYCRWSKDHVRRCETRIGSLDSASQQNTTLSVLPIHSARAKIWISFIII